MADVRNRVLQEQLVRVIREKGQVHNEMVKIIRKEGAGSNARDRVIAWNKLQTRMMQLDEQIRLVRQRIAQDEE